jgi:hypothetical protein
MRTLEEIKGRCRLEPGDNEGQEHWIWTGATRGGSPSIHAPNYTADPGGQTMTVQLGRRAVWHIVHKQPIRRGQQIHETCGRRLCLNPACMVSCTKSKHGRLVAESGRERGKINRILASHKNCMKQCKVTPEMIADAFAMKVLDAAAKHGVDRDLIGRIRNGRSIALRPSNVFAGLMR